MKTLVGQLTQQMNLVGRLGKPGGRSDGGIQTAENTLKVLSRELLITEAEYEEVSNV